jgi:hypothetical protein
MAKCSECGTRGRCRCAVRLNQEIRSADGPKTCTAQCGAKGKGKPCGATMRGQVCPCGFC